MRSTPSRQCLEIVADRKAARSAETSVLLLFEGVPTDGWLEMTSCGVNENREHAIQVNGQPVARVKPDSHRTCICGLARERVAYRLSDLSSIKSGWNHIRLTNDADLFDTWIAYDLQLVVAGPISGAVKAAFGFVSTYDGSTRRAAYKVPTAYNAQIPVPMLVSIGGSGEDRWDALHHYAERTNDMGWLLLAPQVRQVGRDYGGRTASLATQRDIIDAIEYMIGRFNVDPQRIYLSGFSAGGGVALVTAAKYPDVFAAVVDWIGPTDLLSWIEQRPELRATMVANDVGCAPEEAGCAFEWQRRSARSFVMNLLHVPLAIVHGRADTVVPFDQSEEFYELLASEYAPSAQHKTAVWHEGGHWDAVPGMRPLLFLEQYSLNRTPDYLTIRTDESKPFYWLRVVQQPWAGRSPQGFTDVVATHDSASGRVWLSVEDTRSTGSGSAPVVLGIDLEPIGLPIGVSYAVSAVNPLMGEEALYTAVPQNGTLWLQADRDASGQVVRQFMVTPE